MKLNRFVVVGLSLFTTILARAEDWSVDGKDYHNVKVTEVDADCVHIMYDGGIGSVNLSDLPPDLQKRFNYDQKAASDAVQQKAVAHAQADARVQAAGNLSKFEQFLDTHTYTVHIQISQLEVGRNETGESWNTGGALVDMSISTQVDQETRVRDWGLGNQTKIEHTTVTEELRIPQKVFVIGLPDTLVDGDTWDGDVYLLGKYSPKMASGESATFRLFAASREAADNYFKSQSGTDQPASSAPAYVVTSDKSSNAPKASGSGAFISVDGYVLTAAHVVKDASRIEVVTGTTKLPAEVVHIDESNDLAILKCSGGGFTPLPITPSKAVREGATVFTIGFPNVQFQGFDAKLTKGEISSETGFRDDPTEWQISVPIQPGNSGGPLCDENGNLVGLVEATLNPLTMAKVAGEVPQNVNYAVKSSYILPLLDDVQNLPPPRAAASGAKFEDVVGNVKKSVVLILVY